MVLGSINTNVGAQVALLSLNRTNVALQAVQKQVGTGLRVADATDDGGAYAIAQSVRASIGALTTANQQLGIAQGLVGVTLAALTSLSQDFNTLKSLLVRVADAGIGDDQRNQYIQSYLQLVVHVADTVDGASYNGQTLLGKVDSSAPVPTDKAVIASDTGATVPLHSEYEGYDVTFLATAIGGTFIRGSSGQDVVGAPATGGGQTSTADPNPPPNASSGAIRLPPTLGPPIETGPGSGGSGPDFVYVPPPASAQVAAAYNISLASASGGATLHPSSGPLSYFDALQANLLDRVNQAGADANTLQGTINGNGASIDSLTAGLGNLVDADLGKQAAELQALTIRQQLGTQALSLANQAPRALLGLFQTRA